MGLSPVLGSGKQVKLGAEDDAGWPGERAEQNFRQKEQEIIATRLESWGGAH